MSEDLHEAARNGDLLAISKCLQQGSKVNAVDKYKRTPLHLASWAGQLVRLSLNLYANEPLSSVAWLLSCCPGRFMVCSAQKSKAFGRNLQPVSARTD